ncbi:hypothetical protein FO519_010712 [Halicephalobus sp. NKZ332]|nr:hypothetical protein FO519_010712 [Halicephalobus sp. NKZ332]
MQESTTLRQSEGEAVTPKAKNSKDMFLVQGGPGLPAVVAVPPRVVNSSGVVRKKSWRTHYVRPNKSFDQEDLGGASDEAEVSSHSSPARKSSSRRSSTGLEGEGTDLVTPRAPTQPRKSSSSSTSARNE